ncbi:DMT family transporter [Shewanella salipaludis]|uniref:EamA-like transporter family protein n=1 Tax=Shewanella salipaludis TaxID=2723052 RepID=A0A972FUD0_9GAMM|nr:DMT family transporter [Shewanella salipaludis]NMH66348.1 EamA-like transporter family protein [Shewanella salipaludis]
MAASVGMALVMGLVMIAAGMGIPVMAALNGGLGLRLGNPVAASSLLLSLALLVSLVFTLGRPLPAAAQFAATPPHYFMGGFFVAFYILSITWIAPKIGIGNAIFLVLCGQIAASALIDLHHYFWTPS